METTSLPLAVQSLGDGKIFEFPGESEARRFEATAAEAGGETLRLVPALPPTARPLYDLEANLGALLNTEDMVSEDQEREFALELHATLLATVEKRDRVAQFRVSLKSHIALAHAEKMRLDAREDFYQRALDRLDGYLTRIIEGQGFDAQGKRKRLEGAVSTIALHGCDKCAEVTDEQAVPPKYKRVTVTLPAETWEMVCDSLDLDLRDQVLAEVKSPKVEVSVSAAKADLKAGIEIPGVRLTGGTYVEIR